MKTAMVSLTSLAVMAFGFAALATGIARFRGLSRRPALLDALAALAATLLLLAIAVVSFERWADPGASPHWRDAGSLALPAGPLAATAALRFRGRRSIPRALTASALALAAVLVWLTLHLRGPRGGWAVGETVLVTAMTAITITAAACAGWWSKREGSAG